MSQYETVLKISFEEKASVEPRVLVQATVRMPSAISEELFQPGEFEVRLIPKSKKSSSLKARCLRQEARSGTRLLTDSFCHLHNRVMLHKVDQLLDFWLKHSIQIIIIGFILFVLFCIYLILDLLRSQNQTSGESLQVHHQSGGVVLGTDQSSSGQPMIADTALLAKIAQSEMQIQKLQESLKSKDSEIETLKTQSSSESTGGAAASASGEDVAAYVKKISDLEARLLEYEILEDDIADLSLFKEENQKLKQEIEQLKANPSVSTASVETPKIVQQAEAISDKLEAAPMAPETVTAAPTEVANDAGPSISDQVNDLLNQALSEQIEEVSASGPDVHTPAEEAIVSAVPAEPQPSDDLMTEFSASAAETDGSQESDNGLDTEKMMNELASLDAVQGDGSSGLDGDSDIQKMADEADKLLGS